MSPADADLLLAAYGRSGNARDLAALFDATAPELFRVALATAPDAASAEDALQETFLTVMDAAPKFDATRRALPWLVGILKWKVAALRSRRFRSRGDEDTPPPTLADAPADGEADPDELARVRAEIEHLSEPYRSVALLRWRYGLSPAEIAHVRGEPPGTVRSILSRSLERLRRGMRAVPAFFLGTRAERGLDGVRAHLLETAGANPGVGAKPGAGAHAAASTAARAWIAGSLAAGVLLTGAVILWNPGGGGGAPPPGGAPTPPVLAADAAKKGNPPGLAGAGGNPRGMQGAAGAGAPTGAPGSPPPEPPTSSTRPAPSVGRFRAVGTVHSGLDGPKIAHAIVEVFSRWDDREPPMARGETDAAGRFVIDLPTLDALPDTARAQMRLGARARAAGHHFGQVEWLTTDDVSGPPRDVGNGRMLVLLPGHDVVGRIVNGVGQSMARVGVTMSDGTPSGRVTARTDAEGRFRFPVVTAMSAWFLAEIEGLGSGVLPPRALTPDVDALLPDLVVRRGVDVAGVVVDRTGRPAARVPVNAHSLSSQYEGQVEPIGTPAGTTYGSAMTDATGRFRVTGLLPGDLWFENAESSRDGSATETARTGREDVRLVLKDHVVRVAVVDPEGAPVVGAAWRIDAPDVIPPWWRVGEVGRSGELLGFLHVPEDARVVASASLKGWTPAKAEAICAGPGVTDMVLRLVRAGANGRVRIELTGDLAASVTEVYVGFTLLADDRGFPSIERRWPPSEVFKVPPGRYRVEVVPRVGEGIGPSDFILTTAEVTVPPDGDVRVAVPARRGGGVRLALGWPAGESGGELEGSEAKSLDGETAPTSLVWGQWMANGGTRQGRRSLDIEAGRPIFLASGGLPAGRWMLEVRVAGYEPAQVVATIEEGKVSELRVPLAPKPK